MRPVCTSTRLETAVRLFMDHWICKKDTESPVMRRFYEYNGFYVLYNGCSGLTDLLSFRLIWPDLRSWVASYETIKSDSQGVFQNFTIVQNPRVTVLEFDSPLRIQNRVNSLSLNSIWRWIICFPVWIDKRKYNKRNDCKSHAKIV